MTHAFDYLNEARDAELGYGLDDGRLVQQWLWFAAYSSWGSSSDLVEADLQTLTLMGETFRDYVAAEKPAHNLSVWRIPRTVATIGPNGTATALLDVPIRNGGNTLLDKPFHVTFYADAALTQEIDSFIVSPRLKGCALQAITVRGTWPGLEPGRHSYWVHIDSDDVIDGSPPATATILPRARCWSIPIGAAAGGKRVRGSKRRSKEHGAGYKLQVT